MATEGGSNLKESFDAGSDLSASQYFCVQLNSTSKAVLADATVRPFGILDNKPVTGRAARIVHTGITKAMCTGTVAVRDALAPDANGRLVVTTTDNDEMIAVALDAHTGNASLIRVQVLGGQRY